MAARLTRTDTLALVALGCGGEMCRRPLPKNTQGQRHQCNHDSTGTELIDLDHAAEEIPYHIATSLFFYTLRDSLFLSLTV